MINEKLKEEIINGLKESSEIVIDKPYNKVAKIYYNRMKKIESLLSDSESVNIKDN